MTRMIHLAASLAMRGKRSASQATRLNVCVAALLFAATDLHAQVPTAADIPPPDPELERQTLQLADGLEVNLYAADPLLAKPIQMNFDPQGRLWVATSETYPHILPGQAAHDKIIVLEDADRDGRADKTHVFADGLLIPTGIEPGDGGCYVANSTELLHFADNDGDLKADDKRILLSGFGTEDTHHLLHTLRWGPDGWLYMNQSIYIHSHIETPYGVRRLGGGGIWQYHPPTHRLEIFSRGWVNPWGHAFDRWGQSFVTDGAGGEGINYAFPGSTYPTAPGAPRVLTGMNPGSPKYCGLEIIAGKHFPDDWQGDLITCDFRAHRIVRFKLSESGSGYVAREQPEVVKTTHVAFRPIDVKLGPDGALYIADWYNPIIQHGEVDFRDPRRDHTHGRIWRVTVKGRELPQQENVYARPDIDSIYDILKSPAPEKRFAKESLASGDHHIRAAAVRVAGQMLENDPKLFDLIVPMASDDHPQVRLEAICALRNVRTPESIAAALAALDKPLDVNLDFALWQTCREQQDVWLPDVLAEKSPLYEQPVHLEFALRAVDAPAIVPPLIKLLSAGKVPVEHRAELLTLVARLGTADDLQRLVDLLGHGGFVGTDEQNVMAVTSILQAFDEAARTRSVRPSGSVDDIAAGLKHPDNRVVAATARIIGVWKVNGARDELLRLTEPTDAVSIANIAAIEALADLDGRNAAPVLTKLATGSPLPEIRQAAVVALAKADLANAARQAVALLALPESGTIDAAAIVEAFTSRQGGPAALRTVLADKKLPLDTAKLALRAVQSSAKPDAELVEAIRKAGGITGTGLQLSPEQVAAMVEDVKKTGDPARGEALFFRKDLACMKCHAIGGAGGRVGPDLVSIGASAQIDYLIDSMLQPSKAVKEGYHTVVVVTDDGRTLNGVKVRETDRDLILRNAEDQEVAVPLKSIEEQSQGLSLMPVGLADNVTRGELVDMVRFLSELGKVGPYQLKPTRVVRRWESFVTTPQGVELLRRNRVGLAAGNDGRFNWEPAYARLDGSLRLEALPQLASVKNKFMKVPPYTLVRFEFDVQQAGEIDLAFDSAVGLQVWVDGEPIEPGERVRIAAQAGRHTVTVAIDRELRGDSLRCELSEVAGSKAQFQPITVK